MQKVLLAVDGSPASEQAARLLAHLPHADRLDLTLFTVVQHPLVHGRYATSELLEQAYQQDKALAAGNLRRVNAMFDGANATVNQVIGKGNVGQAIVQAAQEARGDLVIIGATGRSQVSRILLGSISDHVATHAHCSVLVVRPTDLDNSSRAIRVGLAYQNNGPGQAALEEIAEIPWQTGCDLHVVTVASYLYDFFGELTPTSDTAIRCNADLQLAEDQLAETTPRVKTHLIESEHLGEGIVDFAEKTKLDLIVVGETPRSTLGRFLMGSTTRYVLRHAPCSVWITRNRVVQGLKVGNEDHAIASQAKT